MNRIKLISLLAFLFFVSAFTIRNIEYEKSINNADLLFSQQESAFVNNYYDSIEKEKQIYENNYKNNNKTYLPNGGLQENKSESSHPLDNLEVPTFTSGVHAYMFAENVLNMASGIHIKSSGYVDTSVGVRQTLRADRIRDNEGRLYNLTVSQSTFAKVGTEAYFNGRQFKIRSTSDVNANLEAKFQDHNWQYTSISQYKGTYGILPGELNYIVNEKTVLFEKDFKFENGEYSFTLVLNTTSSVEKYKQNIKGTSGSADFPTFKNIELRVVILENGKFKSINYQETYSINAFGLNTECYTNYTETFPAIHQPVTISVPSGF